MYKKIFVSAILGVLLALPVLAGEHPGEHPGEEHAGTTAPAFTAAQIKQAMKTHIDAVTKNGVFAIHDEKTHQDLKLKFVKIHDPVREIKGKGYFACTDFEVIGETGKLYDLDFWLNPKEGKLAVTDTKIHKEPQQVGGQWVKTARYTFVNDKPVEVK